MAFEVKNSKIKKQRQGASPVGDLEKFHLPTHNEEKRQTFSLSFHPSMRAKITELARKQGYASDSAFIEDLIEEIYRMQENK